MREGIKKVQMRTCRICGKEKPIDKFEVDSRKKDKRTHRCKSCKYASNTVANKAWHHLKERSAKEGRELKVTQGEIETLFSVFESCPYCGIKQSESDEVFHIDHLIARSAGGTDHISNLICCCGTCNRKKQAKPLVAYLYNEERFSEAGFSLLAHYVAITSGQPIEDVVFDMAHQYAEHEIRKVKES